MGFLILKLNEYYNKNILGLLIQMVSLKLCVKSIAYWTGKDLKNCVSISFSEWLI